MQQEIALEFSRPVDVTALGLKGKDFKFRATDEENHALARRYSVLSVDGLTAQCRIIPVKKGEFRLDATFRANIMQSCSISLDPVEDNISAEFTLVLQRAPRQKPNEKTEIDFRPDERDIELLTTNLIDAGEMIAQYLSLEINPYPRKKNATGEWPGQKIIKEDDLLLESEKKNPFEILKSLKHKT